jgi:hypothetical protein
MPVMPNPQSSSRWQVIFRAWPLPGAVFVLLSFVVTIFQLGYGVFGPSSGERFGWLDPLAAILGGLGAFVLAAVLIFRRVDSARAEAEDYRLARGLATGYYFNFVRPLIKAIRDPQHELHVKAKTSGASRVAGLVVGIPQTIADFDPARHAALLKALSDGQGQTFKLEDIKVEIAGRPRPVFAKLAISSESKAALVVDIPTTLSVIADFAEFVAQRSGDAAASGDEFVMQARKETVSASETAQFGDHLKERLVDEFRDVANKIGAMEPRETSPVSLLDIVPLARLRRRMDELADH